MSTSLAPETLTGENAVECAACGGARAPTRVVELLARPPRLRERGRHAV